MRWNSLATFNQGAIKNDTVADNNAHPSQIFNYYYFGPKQWPWHIDQIETIKKKDM